MTGHTQITQNNKFAISFQNIKKEVSDEVDFVHAEKRESFLQINTIILIGMVKNSESSPNNNFPMFLQDLKKKKKVRDGVHFLLADKNIKVSTNWHYCF